MDKLQQEFESSVIFNGTQTKIDRLNTAVEIIKKTFSEPVKFPVRSSPYPVVVCVHCGCRVPIEDTRCRCGGQTFREF